jgi:hypothetical protein
MNVHNNGQASTSKLSIMLGTQEKTPSGFPPGALSGR